MLVSAKRKLQPGNIERALQGKRAKKAREDNQSVLPASAQADNTQPYGANDPVSLEQHSEDESDVGDEPDEDMTPRTPRRAITKPGYA
ncbi:hypothetical protein BDV93DRAFT_566746 [Ceratobasidium sp. AG-I]|nr:hypothetical protein BDV93DRAFT_566746 [Ceratobasidium sp. AG-I]